MEAVWGSGHIQGAAQSYQYSLEKSISTMVSHLKLYTTILFILVNNLLHCQKQSSNIYL